MKKCEEKTGEKVAPVHRKAEKKGRACNIVGDRYDKKKRKDLQPKKEDKKADPRHESGAKKAERKRKAKPYKEYPKWHVSSMPGLQVILACRITLDKMADTAVLRSLLQKIGKIGLGFSYYIFNAARGYDSDENARLVKEYGMKPSIKLRGSAVCTKMKHSKESVKADPKSYKTRGMIEGIFGAEETENRRLMCRFRKASTRRRFSLCKAVGWNLEALNRFECAASFGMPVEAA